MPIRTRACGIEGSASLIPAISYNVYGLRLRLVRVLRSVLLDKHGQAGRQIGDSAGALNLVDVLPSGSLRPHVVVLQVFIIDFEVLGG